VLTVRRSVENGIHPDPNSPAYRATELRHPKQPLIIIPQTLTELSAPVYGRDRVGPLDHDLTAQHPSPPLGQRIVVSGRVLDDDGRPVP
jgi:protocatechuate 3,4-dioxygenase beta subunit